MSISWAKKCKRLEEDYEIKDTAPANTTAVLGLTAVSSANTKANQKAESCPQSCPKKEDQESYCLRYVTEFGRPKATRRSSSSTSRANQNILMSRNDWSAQHFH